MVIIQYKKQIIEKKIQYYLLFTFTKLAVLEKYLAEFIPEFLFSAACGFTISNP